MSNFRQKNKNLTKKVLELENQLFGQRLLIDELEGKLESLSLRLENLTHPYTDHHSSGIGRTVYPPLTVTSNSTDPCITQVVNNAYFTSNSNGSIL